MLVAVISTVLGVTSVGRADEIFWNADVDSWFVDTRAPLI